VLGLPRGGVPVALEVARTLGAPLDVIVVRKVGVPFQPELGMGAVREDGVRVMNRGVVRLARVPADELAAVQAREQAQVDAARYRVCQPREPLAGRTAVVVDDGIATGSTARAACQVARAHGAARVVLAVPVAPRGWQARIAGAADELVCVHTPGPTCSTSACSPAASPGGCAPSLAPPGRRRLLQRQHGSRGRAVGRRPNPGTGVGAVVSRGGRPDLARPRLAAGTAPTTLLIVGGNDDAVLDLNRRAQAELRCENRLAVVPGATHLFEEPGASTLGPCWPGTGSSAA